MIKKALSSQLRINMASGVVMTGINVVVSAIAFPVYLHFLGYEKFGLWIILATVLSFLEIGGNLGIGPAVTKLVAEEHGQNNIQGIQSYIAMATAILTVSGTVGLIIIFCFKSQILNAFKLSGEDATIASGLLLYIGLLCTYAFITRALNDTLTGLGRMDLTNYIQTASLVVNLLVSATLLYNGRGIESLLIGKVASCFTMHLLSLIFIRRIVRIHLLRRSNWDTQRFRKLFKFGGGVFGGSLLGLLTNPFHKLMLSRYAGIETLPVYELAFRGAVMFRSLFDTALRAIMPEISRLYGEGTEFARNQVRNINRRVTKEIIFLVSPMYIVLMFLAEPLLKIWLGHSYTQALPPAFRIMLLSTFITLVGVPAYYTIMGFGKVRYIVTASIIGAGGNFVLVLAYYALTKHVSVCGVGWCLALSFAVSTVYIIHKARQLIASGAELNPQKVYEPAEEL